MSLADRYFSATELNDQLGLKVVDDLWRWLTTGCRHPRPVQWYPTDGQILYFRGQSDSGHALSNALFRRISGQKGGARVVEREMARVEAAVIKSARDEGIGRHMTDGELLAVLQHHGVPTRLLDFSMDPLDAVFFASETHDERDGRLFIVYTSSPGMNLRSGDEPRTYAAGPLAGHDRSAVQQRLNRWRHLPWSGFAVGTERSSSNWTWRVSPIASPDIDPRMRAQSGCFVVGGQIQAYPGMVVKLNGSRIAVEEWQDITTLSVHFQTRSTRSGDRNTSWPATGWTVRIPKEWKPELRKRLAQWGATPCNRDSMYPPIDESVRLLLRVIKQETNLRA
ncbi:MAG: FRG domain-containing protein [Propionibacteriaceae bacterium]|nr:FRG domain-containing protein [Propionibacteriaceae bacterium]